MLTICIPFYENETLLKKTLDSVLKQSVYTWRLNISLDSNLSDDFTSYLNMLNDKRIHVISNKNENKGICGNWNNCIDSVESDYVTILHSDDELLPNYIEVMLSLINKEPQGAFYFCGAQVIDINSQRVFSFADIVKRFIQPRSELITLSGDEGLSSLFKGCFIFCPSICYKTSVIKQYKFRERWQMVLDLDLYARLLLDGYSFFGTKNEAYRYRRHDNNQTAKLTKDFKRFDEEVMLYDNIAIKASKKKWQHTRGIARRKTIIKLHLLFLVVKSLLSLKLNRAKHTFDYFYQLTKK